MSLIRLSLRRKRLTPSIPSSGLAIPRGAVNGWGTAADFYDSVAVNAPRVLNGEMNGAACIADVAKLGIRHVRDGAIPSWNTWWTVNFGVPFWNLLRARIRSLPVPSANDQGHPIFLGSIVDPWGPTLANRVTQEHDLFVAGQPGGYPTNNSTRRIIYGVDFTPAGIMQFFGGGHPHYNGDAGPTAGIPYVGTQLTNAQWSFADPECPWEVLSHIGGPNEPGFGGAGVQFGNDGAPGQFGFGFGQEAREMGPWMHSLKVAKDQQVGSAYGAPGTLTGNSRIVTETGLQTTAPTRSQVPVVSFVVMSYYWVYNDNSGAGPIGASSIPDMSRGAPNVVDVGDLHPYNYADDPSEEQRDGVGTGYQGLTNWSTYFNSGRSPFNGSQNPSPSNTRGRDPSRELPMFITEWGLTDSNHSGSLSGLDTLGGAGPWPSPRDVNAEYTVRQYLLGWFWGIRRTYYYQLKDMVNALDSESNLGLIDHGGNLKPNGYAVRNLLKLVGFSAPSNNARSLNLTISGYPAGQVNQIFQFNGTTLARQTNKKLHSFQIQQDDDNWLLVLVPGVKLWSWLRGNRNAGNTDWQSLGNPTNGRMTPATETLTITLPQEITDAQVAWPTRGLTPNGASYTWTTPDSGLTWDTLTISGARQITVQIDRYTKIVKLTRGVPATPPTLPIVVPSVGSTPAALRTGSVSGSRLHLKAINVWGLPDDITNNVSISGTPFHTQQYNARSTILFTAATWGANCIRLRMHAGDYNGAPSAKTDSLTKTQILDRVEAWLGILAANQYLCLCTWDALDGAVSGANWAGNGSVVHQMFSDIYARLGNAPNVIYEVTNEPNNVTFAQWDANMRASINHFRETMGYKGVLVIDPPNWANSGQASTSAQTTPTAGYNDTFYSGLEAHDAARTGMGGKHQLVFAKHDYANNYPSNTFNATNWQNAMGGSQIKHLIWANEFGNYNAGGPDPDTDNAWSQAYAIAARDKFAAMTNYVGAAPFLWGPWSDANAITGIDNGTPTSPWGTTARDYYFGTSNPPPPPPSGGFTPGVHFNGDVQGAANGAVSLGAKIVRVEFLAGATATSLDATFTYYADRGLKILLLAAIGTPTLISSGTAANLGTWATRFGPGGTFWASYGGTDRPISHIEFGNESNFNWQQPAGQGSGTAAYQAKARTYATIFTAAYNAIQSANPAVGLLCQGTANDSGDPSWVNNLFVQEPGLAARVNGWTTHPYSPAWANNMNNFVSHLASRDPNKPIDITEVGISTDNGRALNNNYNWPVNLTYSQAATSLQGVIVGMHQQSWWPRIRHWMYYQSLDNQDSGTSIEREAYFGALQRLGQEKGAYSTQVRTIMAMTS